MDENEIKNKILSSKTKTEASKKIFNYSNRTTLSKIDDYLNKFEMIGFFKKKKIEKKCLNCETLINRRNKFCSQSCSAIYNNKNRQLTDDTKNKIRKTLKGRKRVEIRSKGKTTTTNCKNCNNEFQSLNYKLKRGQSNFCSRNCYQEFRYKNKKDIKYLQKLNRIKYNYGLSEEEYLKLFENQNHICPICKVKLNTVKACVDHDHITGKVRGILCDKCNKGIGHFEDNIKLFENVIIYLNK